MNYPKHYGHYLGIVVQNNDPAKRGRVKVFVPHVSPTVYKKWNEVSSDKKFKFVGANVCSDITEILDDLKKILPWAEIAAPLAGESASGRYNAFLNAASISDSNDINTAFTNLSSCEVDPTKLNEESQNLDGIGEKPGNVYDISYYKLKDAFADPSEINANHANVYSYNYTPEAYSNCAKGAFPILRVGAHVWVFFNDGDPLKPIVFAASFGAEDWKGIHDVVTPEDDTEENLDEGIDYPGAYENISQKDKPEKDINTETYRNKYVINQKGGTISFVNTDNKEVLKLTHYSGSFKEFNNFANIELATGNDQKLVLGDMFNTVRGSRNEFTQSDYDQIVQGDYYKKIGLLNPDIHQKWKDQVSLVSQIKSLFDITRTDPLGYGNCPTCNLPLDKSWKMNNSFKGAKGGWMNIMRSSTSFSGGNMTFGQTLTENGTDLNVEKRGPQGQPIFASPTETYGGSVDGSTGFNPPGVVDGIPCPTCGQTGKSPGSQGGSFGANPDKANIADLIKGKIGDLTEIEKQMGLGGSEITEVAKNKIETVGLVMNDFTPVRIDPNGKMYVAEVTVGDYGAFKNRQPTPLVEQVQVDDLPGGTYTLNVCNKYNVLVGAGGLNMKSFGIVNISGAMTNIAGMQVNIGSDQEINIDGGKRVSITADVLSIKQRESKQVLVEGNLGVSSNMVVAGGLHVEGELTANHITLPAQIMETGVAKVYASPNTDSQNKNGPIIGFGVPLSNYPTIKDGSKKSYKEGEKKDNGEPYLGFTDSKVVVGRLKKDENIGYIKSGEIIGYIRSTDVLNILAPPGGGPCTTTGGNIPIYCSQNIVTDQDVAVKASENGSSTSSKDTPVYGSGPGEGDYEVRGSIKGSDAGAGGKDAAQMPIIIYGTGADPDAILNYPHSHTYQTVACSLKETNIDVRQRASGAGYSPNFADPPINAPQGTNSDSAGVVSTISA